MQWERSAKANAEAKVLAQAPSELAEDPLALEQPRPPVEELYATPVSSRAGSAGRGGSLGSGRYKDKALGIEDSLPMIVLPGADLDKPGSRQNRDSKPATSGATGSQTPEMFGKLTPSRSVVQLTAQVTELQNSNVQLSTQKAALEEELRQYKAYMRDTVTGYKRQSIDLKAKLIAYQQQLTLYQEQLHYLQSQPLPPRQQLRTMDGEAAASSGSQDNSGVRMAGASRSGSAPSVHNVDPLIVSRSSSRGDLLPEVV